MRCGATPPTLIRGVNLQGGEIRLPGPDRGWVGGRSPRALDGLRGYPHLADRVRLRGGLGVAGLDNSSSMSSATRRNVPQSIAGCLTSPLKNRSNFAGKESSSKLSRSSSRSSFVRAATLLTMVGWRSMPSLKVSTTFRCSCVKGSARRICRARRGAASGGANAAANGTRASTRIVATASAKAAWGLWLQKLPPGGGRLRFFAVSEPGRRSSTPNCVLEQPVVQHARARPKYPGRELGASHIVLKFFTRLDAPKRASDDFLPGTGQERADSAADKTRYPRAAACVRRLAATIPHKQT